MPIMSMSVPTSGLMLGSQFRGAKNIVILVAVIPLTRLTSGSTGCAMLVLWL